MTGSVETVDHRSGELRGPSAFTGTWRQFWDLLIVTSRANFRNRYVNTALGFIWMFLGPLLFFAVLYTFITQIVQRFAEIPNYGSLLLFNIVLYNLFRQGASGGMRSLVTSGGLVRKMAVPRSVLPLAAIATAFYVFCANMVVVMAWILIAGVEPRWTWLLIPLLVLGMLMITCTVGLLLAGLFVRFRDVGQVWPVIAQVIFYASPVIWPFGFIRAEILWDAQTYNPLAPVLAYTRKWVFDPNAPGWFEARGTGFDAFVPFIIFGVLVVLALVVFTRQAKHAAEDI